MKILEQKHIDSGQIGKFIIVFGFAMFPFSILTFIMAFGSLYKLELYKYMSISEAIIIFTVVGSSWLLICWKYLYPSAQKGGNQQVYEHGNPMKDQLDRIEKTLEELK